MENEIIELKIGKCYAELDFHGNPITVIKIYPPDDMRFSKFIMEEGIGLSSRRYEGGISKSYRSRECSSRHYVEIPEEEYQRFHHLWETYNKSLKVAVKKLSDNYL